MEPVECPALNLVRYMAGYLKKEILTVKREL